MCCDYYLSELHVVLCLFKEFDPLSWRLLTQQLTHGLTHKHTKSRSNSLVSIMLETPHGTVDSRMDCTPRIAVELVVSCHCGCFHRRFFVYSFRSCRELLVKSCPNPGEWHRLVLRDWEWRHISPPTVLLPRGIWVVVDVPRPTRLGWEQNRPHLCLV